jgi:hypothetical protein
MWSAATSTFFPLGQGIDMVFTIPSLSQAERVEASEARYKHNVHTFGASPVLSGQGSLHFRRSLVCNFGFVPMNHAIFIGIERAMLSILLFGNES